MGWTHYWRRPVELPADRFMLATHDLGLALPQLGVPVAGPSGKSQPIIEPLYVAFNGEFGSHAEPFRIRVIEFDPLDRPLVPGFCKTHQLPYDRCVQAALVIFAHHLGPHLQVMSDGDDQSWTAARSLVHGLFGYGEDFQLKRE